LGRFNLKDVIKNIEEYKKPVKKGDYVYILETQQQVYEGKTIYKVAYYDKERGRILVEVDPVKNKVDNKYIKGCHDKSKDLSKLYQWIFVWRQVLLKTHILKNE